MRKQSKKRRQLLRIVNPLRDEYARTHLYCENPDCRYVSAVIHELARGIHRAKALGEPCCLLALCVTCHHAVHNESIPLVRQLRWKKLSGDGTYDLARFNSIRGRAPGAITESEVDNA